MGTFDFRSSSGDTVDPARWVETWSLKFDSKKYPEDCYEELVRNGLNLSDADFDVRGAWKDGGIRRAKPGAGRQFGYCNGCSLPERGATRRRAALMTFGRTFPSNGP